MFLLNCSARWRCDNGHEVTYDWSDDGGEASFRAALEVIDQALNHQSGRLGAMVTPAQIDTCNAVFSPTAEEVEQARHIVDAFDRPENSARNVISVDGRMVERLHADMARRTLAIAALVKRDAPA